MLVEIRESEQLRKLKKETGKPVEKIVNEILGIHLDEKKRRRYLRNELDRLFSLYKNRQRNRER